jgi:hypothetical protein
MLIDLQRMTLLRVGGTRRQSFDAGLGAVLQCQASQPGQLVHGVMALMTTAATGRLLILFAILGCAPLRIVVRPLLTSLVRRGPKASGQT